MFVEAASQIRRKEPQRALNARELGVFRRNIETIIDVASARQIKVVLTTMPHSTDERYMSSPPPLNRSIQRSVEIHCREP